MKYEVCNIIYCRWLEIGFENLFTPIIAWYSITHMFWEMQLTWIGFMKNMQRSLKKSNRGYSFQAQKIELKWKCVHLVGKLMHYERNSSAGLFPQQRLNRIAHALPEFRKQYKRFEQTRNASATSALCIPGVKTCVFTPLHTSTLSEEKIMPLCYPSFFFSHLYWKLVD